MPVLSIWSPAGGVLGAVAPLALAAAVGTALVVDLDPHGPRYPGEGNLARLAAEGPRRADLLPERSGVAVLGNGGISLSESREIVDALCAGWPFVVLRMPTAAALSPQRQLVPVIPLLPGSWFTAGTRPAVYQRCGWGIAAQGPGPVLPRPASSTIRGLLEGRRPGPGRWVRAWRQVWDESWT